MREIRKSDSDDLTCELALLFCREVVCLWKYEMFAYIIAIVLQDGLCPVGRDEAKHKNSVYGGYIESQNNLVLNWVFVLLISSPSLGY